MKKGQILEGFVERVDFPNKGIVCVEGETDRVIVKNSIPGQKVQFGINKKRGGKCEGRLLQVLERSEDELPKSNCEHSEICGGCIYQSLPYEKQLEIKEAQIKRLLDSVCENYEFAGIRRSPDYNGYRNKMEFSFGDEVKDGPLTLGLHRKNSFYDVISTNKCRIVHNDFNVILENSLSYFEKQGLPYYKKMQHVGYLRHLVVRKAVITGEILINIVTTSSETFAMEEYSKMLLGLNLEGSIVGIIHTINDSLSDAVKADEIKVLYGQDYFYEELLGMKFKISPFSFFQTNSKGAEVLYSTARDFIKESVGGDLQSLKEKTIFDLYSGTGTIAQMMSPVAGKVIGVEIVEEAVEAAKENAALNGITNCDFIADDVLKALDEIEEKPDYIILDPPRDGVNPKALEKIINYGVENIIYISCKASSLVRDIEIFNKNGYGVVMACAVDMFPGTQHVETVVLLSKGVVDKDNFRKVKVDFSLEDMDLTELRGKATYAQVKEYILNEFGLKVSSLYIAQVKKKCGIETGENHNLPKSEDARQPQVTPEKEEAIMKAFRHFGVI